MRILVFTTVFPNEKQPTLGVFVRERLFKVGRHCDIKVVAPVPWFPFIELLKPGYRPHVPYRELQDGVEVFHPRFFNVPGVFKFLDGFFLFISSLWTVWWIRKTFRFDVVDSHFIYPDAVAASLIARVFRTPFTVTLRESDPSKHMNRHLTGRQVLKTLQRATKIFSVCQALKGYFGSLGVEENKIKVVPNGVDLSKFREMDQGEARKLLHLPPSRKIIVTVGWLIERKGFHRVISLLPQIKERVGDVLYVVVGGAPGGDPYHATLQALVRELKLENDVLFAGSQPHDHLYKWLNAADIFCLPTTGEGWANVFLEAMACGLPVATSRVGGNAEVVCCGEYGILFDLENNQDMLEAIATALSRQWDRKKISGYARQNSWDDRVATLVEQFAKLSAPTLKG